MLVNIVAALGALATLSSAIPAPETHVRHEARDYAPRNWVKRDRLHSKNPVPVRIGLTQSNLDRIDELLDEVSHPDSPKYGQHYTEEEVHELFAPSQETVDAVRDWLHESGIHPDRIGHSYNKQWLMLDAEIEELEKLLHTTYHRYEHVPSGKSNIACDEYHVPAHVAHHIDYVTPGIKLFVPEKKGETDRSTSLEKRQKLPPIIGQLPLPLEDLLALPLSQLCPLAITPACIREMYKIPKGTKKAKGNKIGIFEALGDVYDQTDLDLFYTTLAQDVPAGTHPTLNSVDGATAPNSIAEAGVESLLDFSIAIPLIYPQGSRLFQTDDDVYQANYTYEGFLNTFLDAIDGSYCSEISPLDPSYPHNVPGGYMHSLQCGVYNPPHVLSISYGGLELDLPVAYQRRQCNEFAKLGMRGLSVLVSSGDSGVGPSSGDCLNGKEMTFTPDFPATCPYLTVAGASFLPPTGNPEKDDEVATTRFPSGGGFSNIYAQPSYQKNAVSTYLTAHKPSYRSYSTTDAQKIGPGKYNRAGRGYPDIAAVGDNVIVFAMGAPQPVGGTSASSPAFASVINLINEERIAAGKTPVGFLNPALYSHPNVLKDVTVGNNPGCGTQGFNVTKGWDPVTGLGTPNYPAMLKLFMSLP